MVGSDRSLTCYFEKPVIAFQPGRDRAAEAHGMVPLGSGLRDPVPYRSPLIRFGVAAGPVPYRRSQAGIRYLTGAPVAAAAEPGQG